MHHRIDTILKQLRQDVASSLDPESIRSACREVGHTWRKCILDPVAIVHWFVIQILHGNTSLEHLARLGGGLFTGEAYCLAQAVLPLAVFRLVLCGLVSNSRSLECDSSLFAHFDSDRMMRHHRDVVKDLKYGLPKAKPARFRPSSTSFES